MSELWQPGRLEPQVSDEAGQAVIEQVLAEGPVAVSRGAEERLGCEHEALMGYLDRFGFELNNLSDERFWPERVLKIGASLSLLAYRETGYYQCVGEDKMAISASLAEMEGIPEAYFSSLFDDQGLARLMSGISEARPFVAPDASGYRQILDVGAGCVRYHLQNALAAA